MDVVSDQGPRVAIRLLAFDFDNTLADSLPVMSSIVNEILRERGINGFVYAPEDFTFKSPMEVLRVHFGATIRMGEYLARFRLRLHELTLFPDVGLLIEGAAGRVPL